MPSATKFDARRQLFSRLFHRSFTRRFDRVGQDAGVKSKWTSRYRDVEAMRLVVSPGSPATATRAFRLEFQLESDVRY